jgi:gliding motility-associated-like protein
MRLTLAFIFFSASLFSQVFTLSFQKSDEYCYKGSAYITVSGGQPPYTINWSNGAVGNTAENLGPDVYNVNVKDAVGNDTVIAFSVEDRGCDARLSNHFTPNDDGYNDFWESVNIWYYPNFELVVYNRWGQQVHKQVGKFEHWDGTSLGVPLPDATYYYVFYYDRNDRGNYKTGDVSILR